MGRVDVRPGGPDDLPALTEIYNHYVVNTHVTFDIEPFTVEARREWLRHYAETGPHRGRRRRSNGSHRSTRFCDAIR